MAITASQVTTNNSLEQFRQEFNNLQSDVRGLESGTVSFSTVATNLQLMFEGSTADDKHFENPDREPLECRGLQKSNPGPSLRHPEASPGNWKCPSPVQ